MATPKPKLDWRWPFLKRLAATCSVADACRAGRVSRDTAYRHRARSPTFRRWWDDAVALGGELLESEARKRALCRTDRDSAKLLMFLLEAHFPAKYRANYRPPDVPSDPLDACDPVAAAAALKAAQAVASSESGQWSVDSGE